MSESDENLAAVVDRRRGDATIRSLRAEGVYDATRRIVADDANDLIIPVTAVPSETAVRDVIEQIDPEPRVHGLADLLADRGFSAEEIDRVPSSWAVVGSVLLVTLPDDCPRPDEVGEALLTLHGEADTVVDHRGVSGPNREPEVAVVAGVGDTETVHVEHGTQYAMDVSKVMFSPGNKAERTRMGAVIAGDAPPAAATGRGGADTVIDMFAGIGYFTLPMARAGARVTAIERNPTAFRYLLENAALNDVTDRIEPYRGDCRAVSERLPNRQFDRAVLGYFDSTDPAEAYLKPAMAAVADGGIIHAHAAVPEPELWSRPIERIERAGRAADRAVSVRDRRTVKTHSEGVRHVVLDVQIG